MKRTELHRSDCVNRFTAKVLGYNQATLRTNQVTVMLIDHNESAPSVQGNRKGGLQYGRYQYFSREARIIFSSLLGVLKFMGDAFPPVPKHWLVQVCQHQSCQRNHAYKVLEAFRRYQSKRVRVAESGCMGQCSSGPTVRIMPDNTWYCRVQPENVDAIVTQHLEQGERVRALLHPRFHPGGP